MDNLQILTEDGQPRPNQPAKEDPNESILDIGDDIDLSETEEDTGILRSLMLNQHEKIQHLSLSVKEIIMRSPVENQLGAIKQAQRAQTETRHAKPSSEPGRQKATSSHGSHVPQH